MFQLFIYLSGLLLSFCWQFFVDKDHDVRHGSFPTVLSALVQEGSSGEFDIAHNGCIVFVWIVAFLLRA